MTDMTESTELPDLNDIYARKAKLNNSIDRFTWKYKYVAVSATWVLTKNISSHLIMQTI